MSFHRYENDGLEWKIFALFMECVGKEISKIIKTKL